MFGKKELLTHEYLLSKGFSFVQQEGRRKYTGVANNGAIFELYEYREQKEGEFKYWWTINGRINPEGLYERNVYKFELALKNN